MLIKPQSSEAAPYYSRYIDRISDNDIVQVVTDQLQDTLELFSTISEEKSLYRYAADKWSIREVVNHFTDSERVFAFRAFWFSRGFETPLPSFDQDSAASSAMADTISWSAHIEEFHRVRLASISLFENMPPAGWTRGGIASDNHVSVRALAYIIAGHLSHHVAILRERYR